MSKKQLTPVAPSASKSRGHNARNPKETITMTTLPQILKVALYTWIVATMALPFVKLFFFTTVR